MASLIPGYNYDIFISYRQKDNKYDGWVTEFVDNLKRELEATFKEEISVYFDINPHDGLLETHDVDESLKEKLKCLVFIPIISRTYCDPKAFAWEHEFKVFVEQASQDKFGLKVKLPGGNVASRVLPIQIHEIAADDKALLEKELGGILRAIEFIYKEPGVNRPLRSNEDHPNDNLNKTFYRNQINKVANAIDEIISSLKSLQTVPTKEKTEQKGLLEEAGEEVERVGQKKPFKLLKSKVLSGLAVIAILIVAAVFAYPKIFTRDKLEDIIDSDGRISIAVMPFQNMTNDTTLQSMVQSSIITSLANNIEEFKVRQIESISELLQSKENTNNRSITPAIASKISKKLDANVFIIGSITQVGATIRLNAQLINSKTKETFKPFQIDGTGENIINLSDSLSAMIANFLIISILKKNVSPVYQRNISTTFPDAFRNYKRGLDAQNKRDFPAAVNWFLKAIEIDTNYIDATIYLINEYGILGLHDQAKKWALRIYNKRDQLSNQQKIWANHWYAYYFGTPSDIINNLKQFLEIDDQEVRTYHQLGYIYNRLYQYDKAIPEFEKALERFNEWDLKPHGANYYDPLGVAYHETGQYKKEKKLYKKAEKDFPDDLKIIQRQAILALSEGKNNTANEYIEKYKSILSKDNSISEAVITTNVASIYFEADILDTAEVYYRKALSLEPENPNSKNNLAWFLIDKDRDFNDGLELVNEALEMSPDNYNYLHTKGWGLYKQGKYQEALAVLQKSWDLRMKNAIYDHTAFLHLEEARKAVASQKAN